MRIRAHDQGYVAAAPTEVYGAVADVGGYGTWWPGLRVTGKGEIALDGRRGVSVREARQRPNLGLVLRLGEPLSGTLEWYLEPWESGTIVNAILDLEVPGGSWRAGRRLLRLRTSIRRGMIGLKEALE